MKPRTLWACQPVAAISSFSFSDAPWGLSGRARIFAVFEPCRPVAAFFAPGCAVARLFPFSAF